MIAPLLGKLYISPASTEDNIRDLYETVSLAVEENFLSDATSRNALYKIHVSLGKIVNQLGEQDKMSRRSGSRGASLAPSDDKTITEDVTVIHEPAIEEEQEDAQGEGDTSTTIRRSEGDSLVEDLLTDGEAR